MAKRKITATRRRETTTIMRSLSEACDHEFAHGRALKGQVAMAPAGRVRTTLERHLRETDQHAERLRRRRDELDGRGGLLDTGARAAQSVVEETVGRALELGKAPLGLVRRSSPQARLLKAAEDDCAAEALQIATYEALERLARDADDVRTAEVAATLRGEEEQMLGELLELIPELADALAAQQIAGTLEAEDLAVAGYDLRSAEEIEAKLPDLSQPELIKIDAYERTHEKRSRVLMQIATLRGEEPWPGYDRLSVEQLRKRLADLDENDRDAVREYERRHKNRRGVLEETERVSPPTA